MHPLNSHQDWSPKVNNETYVCCYPQDFTRIILFIGKRSHTFSSLCHSWFQTLIDSEWTIKTSWWGTKIWSFILFLIISSSFTTDVEECSSRDPCDEENSNYDSCCCSSGNTSTGFSSLTRGLNDCRFYSLEREFHRGVRLAVTYTVFEGPLVFVGEADRITVAAFPFNFPNPVNQTLIYPIPPPTRYHHSFSKEREGGSTSIIRISRTS